MLAEADMSVTAMAMGGQSGQGAGDETLLVRFFNHAKQDSDKTAEAGRPIFVEVPYVEIRQPGNKDSIILRPASQMDIQRFPQHYQAFKNRTTEDESIEGSLLEHWPAVSRSQVEELRYMNVRTVEQLAGMTDTNAQGMMGLSMLRQRAKDYLEASTNQKAADELREARETCARLEAAVKELQKQVATQAATNDAGDDFTTELAENTPTRRRRAAAGS